MIKIQICKKQIMDENQQGKNTKLVCILADTILDQTLFTSRLNFGLTRHFPLRIGGLGQIKKM